MPKQRTSKSWYVTIEGSTEEIKVVGVSSAEAAMERVAAQGHTPLSARPMRKFKVQNPEGVAGVTVTFNDVELVQASGEMVTQDAPPGDVDPSTSNGDGDVDPSTL